MFEKDQTVYAFFKKHHRGEWGPHECLFFGEKPNGKLHLKYKVGSSNVMKHVIVCANMVFAEKPEKIQEIIKQLNNHTGSDKNECLKL